MRQAGPQVKIQTKFSKLLLRNILVLSKLCKKIETPLNAFVSACLLIRVNLQVQRCTLKHNACTRRIRNFHWQWTNMFKSKLTRMQCLVPSILVFHLCCFTCKWRRLGNFERRAYPLTYHTSVLIAFISLA